MSDDLKYLGDALAALIRRVVRDELGLNAGLAGAIGVTSPSVELNKPVFTADEVAQLLSITRKAVFARTARGQIPGAFRVGRSLRFRGPELVAFLTEARARSSRGARR